ncbi:orexigenic neuropeptide QRFP [Rhinoderma darwinii]|uniref:orexigenic neuropeptide QRFP n=1 Tax=Rhinoderma darwinii TaxID=43563 RepID=UPI003F67A932
MRGTHGLCLLLCFVLGFSRSQQEMTEEQVPWERLRFWQLLPDGVEDLPGRLLQVGGPRDKKSTEPASLFSVAKELQGFGKERAGFRFRFGREENEAEKPEQELEKRSGTALGSLAEELNGYNRKKGGFSFRFGRR